MNHLQTVFQVYDMEGSFSSDSKALTENCGLELGASEKLLGY